MPKIHVARFVKDGKTYFGIDSTPENAAGQLLGACRSDGVTIEDDDWEKVEPISVDLAEDPSLFNALEYDLASYSIETGNVTVEEMATSLATTI